MLEYWDTGMLECWDVYPVKQGAPLGCFIGDGMLGEEIRDAGMLLNQDRFL
jgi:hypothetical protein